MESHQPSPYFIRRTVETEPKAPKAIDMTEWTAGEDRVHPLRKYWVTVKRHRWLILISTLAVLLFAFFYSVTRVPLYTAEATVLIERKAPQNLKVQDPRGDSTANDYNNEFYKTQYEILKSPALAERVIREEALQNHTLFRDKEDGAIEGLVNSAKGWAKGYLPASPATSGPAVVTSPTMRLTGVYLAKLEIRPVAGTSLVKVIFTTPDPALSARLANAHADSYLRYGVDLRVQTNQDAPEFLKQRLTQLKERVEQSENALNSYRKDRSLGRRKGKCHHRPLVGSQQKSQQSRSRTHRSRSADPVDSRPRF